MRIKAESLSEHCELLCELQVDFCLLNLDGQPIEGGHTDNTEYTSRLLHLSIHEVEVMAAIQTVTETREHVSIATVGGVTNFVRIVPFVDGTRILGVVAIGVEKPNGDEIVDQDLDREVKSRVKDEGQQLRLENQMRGTNRLQALGSFAGGIAHEFNNMLTVILGNTGLVQMQVAKGTPIMEALDNLEVATLRAAQLANQLLSFSGRNRGSYTIVSLSKMVHEFAPLLRISATGACDLTIDTAPNLPGFSGNVGQIQEILVGLVTNASASYGKTGGTISINTGVVYMEQIDFLRGHINDNFSEGNWVYLQVSDQGSGISDSVKKKMFDPFFSTHKNLAGLGLSACLGIVSSHGGTMFVDSKEGEGTTIRVVFPATIEATVEASVKRMVLMVVDKDPSVLEITRNLLHSLDHDALAIGSGQEAVELFINRHSEIDGVFLDKTMSGMSGLDCFKRIKEIDPNMPVVIMTGFDESSVQSDFGVNRVAAILPKPFKVSGLLEALSSIHRAKEEA
tara:strand:- start:196 stop:1725 length:1530 start_codon:yes stop_codon:yes gene_type:complete